MPRDYYRYRRDTALRGSWVPREEQMMVEEFGDEYRSYMSQTGRIFPRLGK